MADVVADAVDYFSKTYALWPEGSADEPASPADAVFDEFALPLDAAEATLPLVWFRVPLLDAAADHWWGEEAA